MGPFRTKPEMPQAGRAEAPLAPFNARAEPCPRCDAPCDNHIHTNCRVAVSLRVGHDWRRIKRPPCHETRDHLHGVCGACGSDWVCEPAHVTRARRISRRRNIAFWTTIVLIWLVLGVLVALRWFA